MDIAMVIIILVVVIVIVLIGGGLAAWFFLGSRTPKLHWKAQIYQLGDGFIDIKKRSKEGQVHYKLSDLKPYTTDVILKIDKKDGATHYWLQKLKKPTPVVTADCVEVWGQKNKVVRVLLEQDSCTLLKSGYDRKLGTMIFRPMDHDRINMIKTELSERNDRIENTRDILTQITPFVVAGICMIALVIIAYFNAQAGIKIGEYNVQINKESIAAQQSVAAMYVKGINCQLEPEEDRIKQEEPPLPIPP